MAEQPFAEFVIESSRIELSREIYINCDIANPGAVYAALGLFALVGSRNDGVRAAFCPDAIQFRANGECCLSRALLSVLRDLAEADLIARDGQIVALSPRLDDAPPDTPRFVFTAWRGGKGLRTWRACQRAIPDVLSGGLENAIMAQAPLTDERGRWVAPPCRDARLSRWTDRDLGYDRRRAKPSGAPVLELLAVIGLEHFPPKPDGCGGRRYAIWHRPMSYREARARFLLWSCHGDERAFEGDADTWRFRLVPEAGLKGAWSWATKQ